MKNAVKVFKKYRSQLRDSSRIKAQHKRGRLTARERIDLLLDKGSFTEVEALAELSSDDPQLQEKKQPGDGVITGYGTIGQRPVFVYSQDFTVMGGSMGDRHTRKVAKIIGMALKTGAPVIGLLDSGGARIQEGIKGLDGGGEIFYLNTQASGVIPQISAILGPCAGIAVYSPALTDFVFTVDKISNLFITGPDVIKAVTGENVSFEQLGGARIHAQKSGVAHFVSQNEKECIAKIKRLLSYLPQNNLDNPPAVHGADSENRMTPDLDKIVPLDPKKTYDVRGVVEEIFDKSSFLEIHEHFAENVVIGLARLNGMATGVVANQPCVLAGCLDIHSSGKIARFVRFCDAFNIPVINLVDVTGYLPGTDQEHRGIISQGAKILFAYSEATVPKISLVMRKAYGGAYIALVSKDMGYDTVFAWPMAEIAVMGAEQAVNIIFRKEVAEKGGEKVRKQKIDDFTERFLNPYIAAKEGRIDAVIEPKETRRTLIKALEMLLTKRERRPAKKHGNIPL
ncbi:acyl-CoA carboxylase subunit beta [Candidatus Woesearchaeota archaeon]|nr:acyl-CoA carboxylase subunit beta [Candidatus Woesearchaeota archaeon]